MTKWFHKCDLDWLKARQQYLTATDVKELLPFTKTGRKRTITDERYLKVLASKLVNLTEDDCISTGAAARGHILEPYAIDRYNVENNFGSQWLYHWDDIIITRDNAKPYTLAFSPDALDIKVPPNTDGCISKCKTLTTLGEVKSYSPERHMLCGYAKRKDLEERWQIATAMAVCSSITQAYLLLYNPSMSRQLFIVDFDRRDLEDEIGIILEIEQDWLNWLNKFNGIEPSYMVQGRIDEEQDIIRSIMKKEELNPEGEKSVIK